MEIIITLILIMVTRFCSSPHWEVLVKNTVIWLLHLATGIRLLVRTSSSSKTNL